MGEWLNVPPRNITSARHAAPEAAAELEQFTALAARCNTMAGRLTNWMADTEFLTMLSQGYGTMARLGVTEFPRGAEAPSELINGLRNVRDALQAAAAMMSDG